MTDDELAAQALERAWCRASSLLSGEDQVALRRGALALRCRGPLVEALEHLLEWADWHKRRHPAPHMNEPNTGAREEARAALALAKERP